MKKIIIIFLTLLFINVNLFSAIDFSKADDLYLKDDMDQTTSILQEKLNLAKTDEEKSEVYWRLSRVQVNLGDKTESNNEKLKIYNEGLDYALKSIELHNNSLAYLWKASNIGRIGQTTGILKSLAAASDMRGDLKIIVNDFDNLTSSETWYVLGSLYTSVPGGFISFGNNNFGISYFRKAIDTIPDDVVYPNHYKALAEALYKRNWDKTKRSKELKTMYSSWDKASNSYDKFAYYEGNEKGNNIPYYSSVALNKMSDRQEAVMLLNYAIAKFNVWPYHTHSEIEAIEEINNLKSQWT
ncbi:MAG: hypothetical protein ACPKNR_07765 [Pleomorphochaeta sp.]